MSIYFLKAVNKPKIITIAAKMMEMINTTKKLTERFSTDPSYFFFMTNAGLNAQRKMKQKRKTAPAHIPAIISCFFLLFDVILSDVC